MRRAICCFKPSLGSTDDGFLSSICLRKPHYVHSSANCIQRVNLQGKKRNDCQKEDDKITCFSALCSKCKFLIYVLSDWFPHVLSVHLEHCYASYPVSGFFQNLF